MLPTCNQMHSNPQNLFVKIHLNLSQYFSNEAIHYHTKQEIYHSFDIDHFSPNVQCLCEDEDFVKAFLLAIPDKEIQQKFLLNTSNYNSLKKDYNPYYVLFFRRTLPSNIPKHEERWTDVYPIVKMGLRREIPPGPHRIHTIILCDSLQHILSN